MCLEHWIYCGRMMRCLINARSPSLLRGDRLATVSRPLFKGSRNRLTSGGQASNGVRNLSLIFSPLVSGSKSVWSTILLTFLTVIVNTNGPYRIAGVYEWNSQLFLSISEYDWLSSQKRARCDSNGFFSLLTHRSTYLPSPSQTAAVVPTFPLSAYHRCVL